MPEIRIASVGILDDLSELFSLGYVACLARAVASPDSATEAAARSSLLAAPEGVILSEFLRPEKKNSLWVYNRYQDVYLFQNFGMTPQQSSIPLRAFSAACMSLLMEARPDSIFSSCSEQVSLSLLHRGTNI